MLPRSSWKGHLRISLVNVPVQAINAEDAEADVDLHQLHDKCHSRIQYRKFCPIHGEVPQDQIVLGHKQPDDEYVILEKQEVKRGRKQGERFINIDTFVSRDAIDPVQLDGAVYYLIPDGTIAEKPYAVLLQAMEAEGRIGVGMGNFWGRDRLVAVESREGILTMQMIRFASQIRNPETIAESFDHPAVSKEELRLAERLIEASATQKFDLTKYEDTATQKLRDLIESKVDDRETVRPPSSKKGPPVINLMDALNRSVAQVKQPAKKQSKPKTTPRRRSRRSAG